MLIESRDIPVGILDRQTGFIASPKGFLIIIGSSLLILSVLLIIKTLRDVSFNRTNSKKKDNLLPREVLISMILLIYYVTTIRIFGFFINSFILLVITMTIYYLKEQNVKAKNKKQIILIVLKFSLISFISLVILQQIFVRLLGVNLPIGIFGF